MASGSFNTNSWDGRYLQFNWSSSTNTAGNYSTINWEVRARGGSVNWYITSNVKVIIDGVQRYFNSAGVQSWRDSVVCSGSCTINHNGDGSRSFSASVEAGVYYTAVNCRGSGSWWLDQIPRATQPSVNGVGTMGGTLTISTPRASGSFTHTLTYVFGNSSGTIATGVGTSHTWNVPRVLANQIPNATQGFGTITCQTYNGGTHIGTKTVQFYLNVNSADVPSISNLNAVERNGTVSSVFGNFRATLSTIRISFSDAGIYGSTVRNRTTTIKSGNTTFATNGGTSFDWTPGASGTYTITTTVTDTRGRTRTASKTITVNAYTQPMISTFSGSRATDGQIDDDGTELRASFTVTHTAGTNNPVTIKLTIKEILASGGYGTETTLYNESTTAASYNATRDFTTPALDVDKEYLLTLAATDRFRTAGTTLQVTTSFSLVDYSAGGRGIAFGKAARLEDWFECDLMTQFNKNTVFMGNTNLNGQTRIMSNDFQTDLNYATTAGFFYVGSQNNRPENAQGFLIVFQRPAGTLLQMYLTLNGHIWTRAYQNGAWGGWTQT